MQLIDGKKISAEIKEEIRQSVNEIVGRGEAAPHLAAVLVGHDGGSETYVAHKIRACEEVGFKSTLIRMEADASEEELLKVVDQLNADEGIDGFIVQLPLPKHMDEQKVIMRIDPRKDVDGFHPTNLGRMQLGLPTFISATPLGIMELLRRSGIETSGKHCVIVGRSNIVGKPLSILLSNKGNPGDCTVTLCHSRTKDLKMHTREADILVAALGQPGFIGKEHVKPGCVIIDVGTTRVADSTAKNGWRLKGDVLFEEVAPMCSHITPVPGGVGPMTIASLMRNTLLARSLKNSF